MTLALTIPGGAELLMILIVMVIGIASPILAIAFYVTNNNLKKRVKELKDENANLLNKLLEKKE